MREATIHRVIDLIGDEDQLIQGMSVSAARQLLLGDDPGVVSTIRGSFALVARDGERVALARSLNRPLRYFLAKEPHGPMLVVADRIDAIQSVLDREGYGDQFYPTYTRMAPAHYVTELRLIGCPDPNPTYRRFLDPTPDALAPDLDTIGERYVAALCREIGGWLDSIDGNEPIGVLFSGGLDSGVVLLGVYSELLARGQSAARLKAFTLSVDGGGDDVAQAREFLRLVRLPMLGEEIDASSAALDPLQAVEVIEDYRALDVECATVNLALLGGIRARYPSWRWLVDGDGGDENLKDYPIEENPELTIRSVVTNRFLYQEGWGVESIKHSLTYSGGLSRGCVRGYAPAHRYGFCIASPHTTPAVVAIAGAIPFAELAQGSHETLYQLKGEVLRRGVARVLNVELPVFPKRRFQHGAMSAALFEGRFGGAAARYRAHLLRRHQAA